MSPKQPRGHIKIIIVLLVVVLAMLVALLYAEYLHLRRLQLISAHRLTLTSLSQKAPLTVNDVSSIQSWMTFNYLNKVFLVPRDYFKNSLNITDPRYPQLTLARWAREKNIDIGDFVKNVRAVLTNFLNGEKASSTGAGAANI